MRLPTSTVIFPTLLAAVSLSCVIATHATRAADDSFRAPDSLLLKNGKVVKGLIVRNTRSDVTMQRQFDEVTFPKSEIVRIYDEVNVGVEFTDITRKGELPAWRVIANDLRTNDAIKSMVEIPATLIDNGEFKNVPYKSFRVNNDLEVNIYGDPENPAGLELGIYGSKSGDMKLRKTLRSFLAGFLNTREEVGALYKLNLHEGIATAGNLVLEITPKNAPDAYGAWWISLYNKKSLDDARLDDQEYAKLVRPFSEVVDKRGRVIENTNSWTDDQFDLSRKIGESAQVLLRGFYRDKNGEFRLITPK